MLEIVTSIVCSVVATLICSFGAKMYLNYRKYKSSEYSGIWYDEIYDIKNPNVVVKRDEFNIRHNKKDHTITGTISRYFPEEQKHRKWSMNGVIYDRYVIISFWRIGPQKSNGCIYAKLSDDNIYDGFYLEEHEQGQIDKTPIRLFRKGM